MIINSLKFDNSFIEIKDFPSFGNEYTIQFWIKPYKNIYESWVGVIERGNGNTSQGIYISENQICYTNSMYGRCNLDNLSNFPIDNFTHISITHKDNIIKYYRNGKYINSFNTGKSINSEEPLYLGEWIGGYPIFDGELADVRIWNCKLSNNIIKYNFNKNISSDCNGLKLRYLFENQEFSNLNGINYNIIKYGKIDIIPNILNIYNYKCMILNNNKYMTISNNKLIEIEKVDYNKMIFIDKILSNNILIGDNKVSPISLFDNSFKILIFDDTLT